MNSRRDFKKILIPLIMILFISIGISYAYWVMTTSQSGINKIDTLKCLNTSLTDITSAINLTGEYPISNYEGMQKNPYTFKITNLCDGFIEVDINLEVLSTSTLGAAYVRTSLNNEENTIDNSNVLTNYSLDTPTIIGAISYTLQSKIQILPYDSKNFDLRLWLDEATTTEQGANKIFNAKIVVNASPTAIPVNLTVNLPSNLKGNYDSTFEGASWNIKTASLRISSVSSANQNITLLTQEIPDSVNFASHIISLAGMDQGNGKVINENGYRYEGKNPNNWVWFNNEYWRIVGVFDDNTHKVPGENLVKLMRNESIGSYTWNKNNIDNWNTSSLKPLLNNYYYNGINEPSLTYCMGYSMTSGICNFTINGITNANSRNMIENATWKLGGNNTYSATAETFYTAERGTTVSSGNPIETTGHIGLIYPSDYGYSVLATSCARTTFLYDYSTNACAGASWLYGQGYEWMLTHNTQNSNVFYIHYSGALNNNYPYNGYAVRPSVYLKSNVNKITGDGSIANPYILSLES